MTQQFQRGRSGPSRGRRPAATSKGASTKSSEAIRPLQPTLTPPDIATFRHWALGEEIQGAIEGMGITVPTPIQRLAIGPVLEGKDVIAKAETGTGKTLAFGAPMMAKIDPQRASVLGLALCPTRELAEQVMKVLAELGKPRGIQVALIVGGEPAEPQVRALKAGAQVVVGTPGRILDLYKQKFLSFPWTEFVILDEADVMFEIGFIDDVKEILSLTPEERQTLLFSATFPPELLKLARANTRDPAEVATAAGLKTVDTIEQSFIRVDDDDRGLALMRLIENSDPDDVFLVFCSRRTDVDKLFRRLERMPYSIKALHGGYDQAARFRVMSAFRTGEVKALIATDVASRGLDVLHVTTVVNFGSPQDITDYTHRIGRTGRAGRKGRAVTLVGGMDHRRWTQIQREATWDIHEAERPMRGDRPLLVRVERSSDAGPDRAEERDEPRRSERAAGPQRSTRAPAQAREERPRRTERPAGASGPRALGRPADADPRGERAPQAEGSGHADRGPRRSWPRDEHAPIDYAAPLAAEPFQVEPRPDDPIDRRDRPLRKRPDVPQWPIDEDAPPPERPARRDARPAARSDAADPRAGRPGPVRSDPRSDRRTQPDVERDVRPRGPDSSQRDPERAAPVRETRTGRAVPPRDTRTERAAPARDTSTERAAPARDTSTERAAPARDTRTERAAPSREARTERAGPAREARTERASPAREERPARSPETRSTPQRGPAGHDAPTRRSADAPRASLPRREEPPPAAPRRTSDAPRTRQPEGPARPPASGREPRLPAPDASGEPRRETGPRRTSSPPRAPGRAPQESDRPASEPRGRERGRGR